MYNFLSMYSLNFPPHVQNSFFFINLHEDIVTTELSNNDHFKVNSGSSCLISVEFDTIRT